jgi:hypothetical protein
MQLLRLELSRLEARLKFWKARLPGGDSD